MRRQALKSLLLLLLLLGIALPAAALNFNAFWLYRTSGGEGRDRISETQQRYNLGVGPQLDWQPTHAIRATANISYSQTQFEDGEGKDTIETISPSAYLDLHNDVFTASLAGSAGSSRTDSDSDNDSDSDSGWGDVNRSWSATLSSNWDVPLWPKLNYNYSQTQSDVDGFGDVFSVSDRTLTTNTVNVDWDLLLARLTYRYGEGVDEDFETGDRQENVNHFARVETNGALFADRISYNLSQQYQYNRQNGETFGELRLFGSTRAKVDDRTPANDPFYEDPDQALPLVARPLERIQVFFSQGTGLPERIDLVRLAFGDLSAPQAPLDYELYQRSSDFDDWQLVGPVTGIFDPDGDFVEIAVNLPAREILLIAGPNQAGADLILLQFGAFTVFGDGATALNEDESESTSWLTDASLGVRLTRTLSAAFSILWDQQDTETSRRGGDQTAGAETRTEGDFERQTLNGSLRWSPLDWLSSTIAIGDTHETNKTNTSQSDIEFTTERNNRNYTWSLLTQPLETMSVSFAVTRTENDASREGEERENSSMQYRLTTTARLYPDLNAIVTLSYADTEDQTSIERSRQETRTDTESYGITANLDARLTKNWSADVNFDYRDSTTKRKVDEAGVAEEPLKSESERARANLNLRYRPSSYLSLSGSYTTFFFDESDQPDIYSTSLSLALLNTRKTRLNLNHNFTHAEDTINSFNLNGSWDISRNWWLRASGSYTMAETNFYAAETSLNFRF